MSPFDPLLMLTSGLLAAAIVGVLARAGRRHRRARERAEWREQLLLSVLRTDSLATDDVLEAVVEGLATAGFDASSIRMVDHEAGVLRFAAGRGVDGASLAPELPMRRGFSGRVLHAAAPIVLDDYSRTPGVLNPQLGIQGMIGIPLGPSGARVALLQASRRRGQLSQEQIRAATVLAEQAGRALERALDFEANAGAVEASRALAGRVQDFISTVSHELRTPLTVVQGLGQTLAHRWDDLSVARRADLATRLHANAERLMAMVASLLESSALQNGSVEARPAPVALRPLVAGLLHRLATIRVTHPVEVDIDPALWVHVDAGLIEHVLENLLTNAATHTPQGTAVRVAATAGDGMVRISVSDDGPGIPAEDLPYVLERFYRGGTPTERAGGGLGLGLALASQIVTAHGSRLEIASEEGRGTTFWFSLPIPPVSSFPSSGNGADLT